MDPRQLLDLLTKSPAAGAAMGGLAGSVLGNVLTGKGGGLGKKAIKYGGLAAVGYVAWQAWQSHQATKGGTAPAPPLPPAIGAGPTPPALPQRFDLDAPSNVGAALLVVQAMVAASKADGVVESSERDRIFARVNEAQLSQADQDQVLRLLTQPMDLEAVVQGVSTPELGTEVYAASVIAVAPANRAERAYLDMLAARLGLESALVSRVEQAVEGMQER